MTSGKLFVPLGHFYSPISDRDDAAAHIKRIWNDDRPVLGIDFDDKAMQAYWNKLSNAMNDIPFSDHDNTQHRYFYLNDQFSYGDACVYFAQLKLLRPKKVIEIGSGYSSALAIDVRELHQLDTELIFIEPYPTRLKGLLKKTDKKHIQIIQKKVQHVNPEMFETLQKNDILFIDSSHVAKTGSDVCFEIFEILPRLKPGVNVIIHDMFYPFEYPHSWAVEENRSWNEAYIVRAFLMHNPRYSVKFFNHYFGLKFSDQATKQFPLFMKNPGGSLWLKVNDH